MACMLHIWQFKVDSGVRNMSALLYWFDVVWGNFRFQVDWSENRVFIELREYLHRLEGRTKKLKKIYFLLISTDRQYFLEELERVEMEKSISRSVEKVCDVEHFWADMLCRGTERLERIDFLAFEQRWFYMQMIVKRKSEQNVTVHGGRSSVSR